MNSEIYQKWLKSIHPALRDEVIKRVEVAGFSVNIYWSNEANIKGEWVVADSNVYFGEPDYFWLECFKNRKSAVDFCKEIGWKINDIAKKHR